MNVLTGEVIVDFHVLANVLSALINIAISTFLHSLPLASLKFLLGPLLNFFLPTQQTYPSISVDCESDRLIKPDAVTIAMNCMAGVLIQP